MPWPIGHYHERWNKKIRRIPWPWMMNQLSLPWESFKSMVHRWPGITWRWMNLLIHRAVVDSEHPPIAYPSPIAKRGQSQASAPCIYVGAPLTTMKARAQTSFDTIALSIVRGTFMLATMVVDDHSKKPSFKEVKFLKNLCPVSNPKV